MKNRLIAVVFTAVIFIGSITAWCYPVKEYSKEENRALQKMPEFNFQRLIRGKYIKEFENFTTDQFPLRNGWVAVKSYSDLALGKKDNGKVYFGSDETLFSMDDIDLKQQRVNVKLLCKMLDNIKSVNPKVGMSVLIAPTAPQIWKDKLPMYAQVPSMKQVDDVFEDKVLKSGAKYIKTYSALKENQEKYIYYRTDHHWTTYGAYLAANEFKKRNGFSPRAISDYRIKRVSNNFYGTNQSKTNIENISPDSIYGYVLKKQADIKIERTEQGNRKITHRDGLYFPEFLKEKDKYSYFLGGNSPLIKIRCDHRGEATERGRTLLVIRDSYANCFIPFLTDEYDKILAVDFRYFKGGLRKLTADEGVTDVLVLYNMVQISNDRNLVYGTV